MSVINQMLKDLDKRQQEPTVSSPAHVPVIADTSKRQQWLVGILVLLLLISLAVIVWQKMNVDPVPVVVTSQLIPQPIPEPVSQPTQPLKKVVVEDEIQTSNNGQIDTVTALASTKVASANSLNANNLNNEAISAELQNNTAVTDVAIDTHAIDIQQNTKVFTQPTEAQTTEIQPLIAVNNVEKTPGKIVDTPAPIDEATLTISRKQLTATELASKKIAQAEQAIASNNIPKAEQLFEDVLLILPTHKAARKQLAALWFGKQSYQAALNLLSQGLALDNQDEEFRLMKARIYLSQGQAKPALEVLMVLDNLRSNEYQSLLASTAQQLGLFAPAEKAYSILTELSPNTGRWWLGLAIAQDSQSQFSKAKESYQNALKQLNLSSETAQFAKNRIIELGE